MTATLDALVAACGPDRLRLVHANDSRDPCGSLRDRHENIGKGTIGEAAFGELLHHPAVVGVPVVVETPSGDSGPLRPKHRSASEGYAGHAADIARLKALR
jgi:deoxyribonuclease-4